MTTDIRSPATAFRSLHVRGTPVVLYNARCADSAGAIAAGAIGCNLEDSDASSRALRSAEERARRLAAARRAYASE